jgi:hypothetical protein
MTVLSKMLMTTALLGACVAARAGTVTFDFSYTFGDGQSVTGDFAGTTTNGGQSVTNISNIQVQLNGIAFAPVVVGGVTLGNSVLQANTWNPLTQSFSDTLPVTIYANGALNNFIFSDVDVATNPSPDYQFGYVNDATNNLYEAFANNFLQSDSYSTAEGNPYQSAADSPGNAADWTLTEVTPPSQVPIPPAALLVLASALCCVGSRRRHGTA